jgi:hypothetical protein
MAAMNGRDRSNPDGENKKRSACMRRHDAPFRCRWLR